MLPTQEHKNTSKHHNNCAKCESNQESSQTNCLYSLSHQSYLHSTSKALNMNYIFNFSGLTVQTLRQHPPTLICPYDYRPPLLKPQKLIINYPKPNFVMTLDLKQPMKTQPMSNNDDAIVLHLNQTTNALTNVSQL